MQQRSRSTLSFEETAVDRVKAKWQDAFGDSTGSAKWEAMSEEDQRDWFQGALESENVSGDASSGLVDVKAEWKAIEQGTHAPTDVAGYRTLIEAAVADERFDLAMSFARHLLHVSGYAHAVPIDTWNLLLYQMPGGEAKELFQDLQRHPDTKVDAHTFTAVMSALGEAGELGPAFELLAAMEAEGLEPNAMTYNTLILDSGNSGDLNRASETLGVMESKGLQPLMEVYEMLAALAEHKGETESAKSFGAQRDELLARKKSAEPAIKEEFGL